MPVLVGVPATLLIPNRLQTESLIDWANEKWYEGDEREERSLTESLFRVEEETPEEQDEEDYFKEDTPNEHLCP